MKRPVILLLHLFYWGVYFCLLSLLFAMTAVYGTPVKGRFTDWNLLMLGFAIIPGAVAFYGAYCILFKRLLQRRKILLLILSLCGLSLVSTGIGQLVLYNWAPPTINWTRDTVLSMGAVMWINAILNGTAGLALKSFITWYQELRWKEELRRKNHETELALIRLQLSPHFLFNTINNIDILIGQDPEKASAYLNKLSDIMRFMLYESKADFIPLEKELLYIENYLSLQQIRTANPDYTQYEITGSTDSIQIPPMVFIPFIENAFKHSIPQKTGTVVAIRIMVREDSIVFECTNKYTAGIRAEKEYGGLGNDLMTRRLQLLYAGRHQVQINQDGGSYHVKLTLPL